MLLLHINWKSCSKEQSDVCPYIYMGLQKDNCQIEIPYSVRTVLLSRHILNESNVISFQQNPSQLFPGLILDMNLKRVIQHKVHVLIEPDYVSLNTKVVLFVQPDLNASSILQVSEDQVDRLYHHLLNFLRHDGFGWIWMAHKRRWENR